MKVEKFQDKTYYILETEDDVNEEVSASIEDGVDWFDDEPSMPADEFFDRMFGRYGLHRKEGGIYDLEETDNPAAKKILRIARKIRKERQES